MEKHEYFLISQLHLVNGASDFREDDIVKIQTYDGMVLFGNVTNIKHDEIDISFGVDIPLSGNHSGGITVKYDDINEITLVERT